MMPIWILIRLSELAADFFCDIISFYISSEPSKNFYVNVLMLDVNILDNILFQCITILWNSGKWSQQVNNSYSDIFLPFILSNMESCLFRCMYLCVYCWQGYLKLHYPQRTVHDDSLFGPPKTQNWEASGSRLIIYEILKDRHILHIMPIPLIGGVYRYVNWLMAI